MNKKKFKDIVWKLSAPIRVALALIIGFIAILLLAFSGGE